MIENSALFLLTIILFMIGVWFHKRKPSVFTLPLFTVSAMMMVVLLLGHIDYEKYLHATQLFNFTLGPAIVAFAFPLYQIRGIVWKFAPFVVAGFTVGICISLTATYLLSFVLPISPDIVHSLWEKNVTLPVAMSISQETNGSVALTSIAVILSGCIGLSFGHKIMNWMRIHHFVARGVAMAAAAHIFGTNASMALNKEEGGIALVTMAGTAIMASVIIPLVLH
ncbi:Inner membrane protein yohK [Listeria grayi]|uniref:LrgB-like protein n=2 Tax=Listeria grayi TaxID=1641 RepID=D7UUU8_LISGR|nr:LrgB family protein [Listeria grayi]EFI85024.1 LrgB-like protein [Listeria grayi DSM 20601]EUJ28556.1 hypothetical protein LMUR_05607 [Listeria grayi FSL F6-1183]MBC1922025.1 LrgB family protein [Listeria grayi]VEI30470.1 Inner membrane protein yohK [Listeria grayi]